LALARVLLHNPEVVFLDEPTSGLDPIAAHHLHEIMIKLSREENRTIFLCTHNLTEAQQLCDRVGIMEHGHLMALGTPGELVQQLQRNLRIEIEIDPNTYETAIRALQALPAIHLAKDTPKNVLRMDVMDRELIPDILQKLIGAGVRVYRTDPQDLTLEDVYFILHGENAGLQTTKAAEGLAQ
jgi:ABC-2 type transport system ATP-binding protein